FGTGVLQSAQTFTWPSASESADHVESSAAGPGVPAGGPTSDLARSARGAVAFDGMNEETQGPVSLRLGGERRTGAATREIARPFDGGRIAAVALASEGDVRDAIARAHAARTALARANAHLRRTALETAAARLAERSDEAARTIADEAGKPIRF